MTKINHEEYRILKELEGEWEWIARSGNDDLLVYRTRPFKSKFGPFWTAKTVLDEYLLNVDLFQFIQWEDEEPYNITELIEGYTHTVEHFSNTMRNPAKILGDYWNESEKKEVKRNKEWLIKRVENYIPLNDKTVGHVIDNILDIIHQLDEPEVLSQEWIVNNVSFIQAGRGYVLGSKLQNLLVPNQEGIISIVLDNLKEYIKEQQSLSQNVGMAHTPSANDTYYRKYDFVLECIDGYEPSDSLKNPLIPKKELPVVPKYVADWIEDNKQFEEKWNDYSKEDAMNDTIHFTIYGLFADYPATNSHVELRKPVLKWLSVDRGNYFRLVNAVHYGYQVKEEKYIVRFNRGTYKPVFIALDKISNHIHYVESHDYNKENLKVHLSESEIRALDDGDVLFEYFAVKVEGVEE